MAQLRQSQILVSTEGGSEYRWNKDGFYSTAKEIHVTCPGTITPLVMTVTELMLLFQYQGDGSYEWKSWWRYIGCESSKTKSLLAGQVPAYPAKLLTLRKETQ